MGNQRLANAAARADQQRKHAFGQALLAHRLLDGAAHQFGRAQVGAVRLHHHGRSGSEGRGRVAPGHRESQREVAGAEHRHGAERHPGQPQVRTRQGLALRLGRVDGGVQEVAVSHNAGEEAQLTHGAAPLAGQARHWQPGFHMGALY